MKMAKKKKVVKATYVMFLYEDDDAEVMLPNGQIATVIDHEECEISAADVDEAVFRILRGKKIFLHSGTDIEYAREFGGDDDATDAQRKSWKLEVHPTISFS
jgi:hypothetical protein